VKTAAAK